jgi:hypothetical protein
MKAKQITILSLAVAAALTQTTKSAGVDISDLIGDAKITLDSSAGGGADHTMNVKLQESDDDVDAHYTDVANAAFDEVTNAAAKFQTLTISANARKKYVRIVSTLAGTNPAFTRSVTLTGEKQYS